MAKLHIHQIFYSEETRLSNDPGFLGLDNLTNLRPDWREYWPIRNCLLNNQLVEDDYYGFFSPKFKSKTNLSAEDVYSFINASTDEPDVFLFSPFFDQAAFSLNIFQQAAAVHDDSSSAIAQSAIIIAPNAAINEVVMDSTNIVYCNYFVAKPAFWRVWLKSCELIFSIAEENTTILGNRLNTLTNHDGGEVSTKVFIIERVASLLLSTQKHWKVKAFNPWKLPNSNSYAAGYPDDLLLMDALKIAYNTQGYPEYLPMFIQVQDTIVAKIALEKKNRTEQASDS